MHDLNDKMGGDNASRAKMDVLHALKDIAMELIHKHGGEDEESMPEEGLDLPIKKVSVMAPDKQGLAEGLDKAEDVVQGLGGDEGHEDAELGAMDLDGGDDDSEESDLMAKLEALRAKKKMK